MQASDFSSYLLMKSENPVTKEGITNLLKILIGRYTIPSRESEISMIQSIKDIIKERKGKAFEELKKKGFITRLDIIESTGIRSDSLLDFILTKLVEMSGSLRGIQAKHFIELLENNIVESYQEENDEAVIISQGDDEDEENYLDDKEFDYGFNRKNDDEDEEDIEYI